MAQGAPATSDTRQSRIRITFEKGLDESLEESMLPEGFLSEVRNWEPDPTGGLRVRRGWVGGSDTFDSGSSPNVGGSGDGPDSTTWPGVKKVRGIGYLSGLHSAAFASPDVWAAALYNPDNSNRCDIFALEAKLTGSRSWKFVESLGPIGTDIENYPVVFCKGITSVLYSHPMLDSGVAHGIKRWDGTIPAPVERLANSPPVRALTFHKERFFAGGTDPDNANWITYRLYFSRLGNRDGWAGPGDPPDLGGDPAENNWIDIAAADGTPIEDLLGFQGYLVIGKASGVFLLAGSDIDTFQVTPLGGTARVCRGRSLVNTPKGLVILGETTIWLWNGGDPVPISRPVERTYAAGRDDWRTGAYADGKVFITSHADTRMLVFDTERGVWWIEETNNSAGDRPMCVAAYNDRLVMGPEASAAHPALSFRDYPDGDRVKDFGSTDPLRESFLATTPRYFPSEPQLETVRGVWVRLRQRGNGGDGVLVSLLVDGETVQSDAIAPVADGAIIERRFSAGSGGTSWQLRLSGTMWQNTALFDVEAPFLERDVLPLRT